MNRNRLLAALHRPRLRGVLARRPLSARRLARPVFSCNSSIFEDASAFVRFSGTCSPASRPSVPR